MAKPSWCSWWDQMTITCIHSACTHVHPWVCASMYPCTHGCMGTWLCTLMSAHLHMQVHTRMHMSIILLSPVHAYIWPFGSNIGLYRWHQYHLLIMICAWCLEVLCTSSIMCISWWCMHMNVHPSCWCASTWWVSTTMTSWCVHVDIDPLGQYQHVHIIDVIAQSVGH